MVRLTKIIVVTLAALCFVGIFGSTAVFAADKEKDKGLFADFGLEVRVWFPTMDGKVKRGSELDFKDSLGMDNKTFGSVKANFGEQSKWRLRYDQYTFKGDKTLASPFVFNNINYAAGDKVHSEIDLKYLRIDYLPNYRSAGDNYLSWVLGLKGLKFNSELNVPGVANKQTERSFNALVPSIGARFETGRTKHTSYYGEVTSLSIGGKSYVYDLEIGLHHRLSTKATFSGGYRSLLIKAQKDDEYAKINLSGPFAQFNYKF